jgi:hypothetical protein
VNLDERRRECGHHVDSPGNRRPVNSRVEYTGRSAPTPLDLWPTTNEL